MPRERGEDGVYVEDTSHEDVLGVFDLVEGPVITSGDVADALGCSTETARRKLTELYDEGRIGRRKTAGRVVYWRLVETYVDEVDHGDAFWNADPVSGEDETSAPDIDDVLYGDVEE